MSKKSLSRKIRHEVDDTLDDVATALREAADGLGDDAEKAIAKASLAVRQAAEVLARRGQAVAEDAIARAPGPAKELARKAVQEVKEHPLASAAAALTAAAALISLLSDGRDKKAA